MDKLRAELEKCASASDSTIDGCTSILLIIGCIVPFVVLAGLWYWKPMKLCKSPDTSAMIGPKKLDPYKTAGATLAISAVFWIILYLLGSWGGLDGILCAFS